MPVHIDVDVRMDRSGNTTVFLVSLVFPLRRALHRSFTGLPSAFGALMEEHCLG